MTLFSQQTYWRALGLAFFLLWPVFGKSSTDPTADQILGRWLFPAKGSSVEIYRTGDHYCARIADVSATGQQKFGLVRNQILMRDLTFDGAGWSGGELIHPQSGLHFGIELKLLDSQTMTARVFKGVRWVHKEFTLTRQTTL